MRLTNIFKSYGKQKVFEDFSLEIQKGEILCVLGESGGGKTTLLNILAELISFEGEKVAPKKIAYAFQEPRLLPNLTARENIAFVGGKVDEIDDLLEKVELLDKADKRPSELSGGERQRVSLARAFSVDFELLLLDEPFSSLDTGLKVRLMNVFARLWERKKEGASAVFVTHDIEEALMIADRVVVLKGGKIAYETKIARETFPSEYGKENPLREELLRVLLT